MFLHRCAALRYGTDMPQTDRYELVRRDLDARGINLDALVTAARKEGVGWRVVATRITDAGNYTPPISHTSVRRWYGTEPVAA